MVNGHYIFRSSSIRFNFWCQLTNGMNIFWLFVVNGMKVELEMYIDDQESIVMEKVLVLTKKAEELGFRIVETEVEGGKDEEHEERQEEREEEESKINEI